MRNREIRLLGAALVALVSAFSAGCAGSETGPEGTGGSSPVTGSGGTGGEAGQGGQTGSGGEGGSGAASFAATPGPLKPEFVAAGSEAKSGSYHMVFSFGQPFDQRASSPKYRVHSSFAGDHGSIDQ